MDKIVVLLYILGFGLLIGGLVGIWLSFSFFGVDLFTGLIVLGVSIAFTIIGIAWVWYTIKHFG